MKKIVKLISIILASMIFVVGCSGETESVDKKGEAVKDESEYINLTMIRPDTLNPILNTDESVSYILDLVYDSLFEFDENYNLKPKLVDTYSVSSNNKSVNITLKDNIKWHNGKKLTSSDVRYTYNLIKSQKTSAYYNLVSNIKNIEIKDSKNFEIKFKESYAFSLETLIFPIVSKSQLSGLKDSQLKSSNKNLIGCGYYKIKDYQEKEYIILEPYKDYYNLNQEANNREIYVKLVPDSESQTQMVLSLDSDMSKVSLSDISKFTNKEKFKIEKYQDREYDYVIFNYSNKYLQNLDIRKAITFAIDRKSIIKNAYSDRVTMTNFPLNINSKYYDSDLKPLSYNTNNANNYLKKAVLSLSNSVPSDDKKSKDDKLDDKSKDDNSDTSKKDSKKDAKEKDSKKEDETSKKQSNRTFKDVTKKEVKELLEDMEFTIIVNKNNTQRVKAANLISNNLEAIGIKTTIKDLTDDQMKDALNKREYDLALIGCVLPSVSDSTYVINQFGYTDEKLYKYQNALQSSNSEKNTKKAYKDLQKYVKDNALFISFGILDSYVVLNNRVEGDLFSNDFNVYKGISSLKLN